MNAFGGYGSEDIGSLEYDYDSCSEEGTDPVLGILSRTSSPVWPHLISASGGSTS